MVFFTTTAQIIDTLIIKFSVFTIEQCWYLIKWGGVSTYHYYYPTLSENDILRLENLQLKTHISLLNFHHDNTNSFNITDDPDDNDILLIENSKKPLLLTYT